MPTVIIANPLRALQVENQRLNSEVLALRRENEALRQERAPTRIARDGGAAASPVPASMSAGATPVTAPALVQSEQRAPLASAAPRGAATQRRAQGPGPRQVIHLVATEAPVPSITEAPVPSITSPPRASPDVLDDATIRFQLLEFR